MAHIAKYKATSVGHMLAHYRRDASSLERDNIDPSRVKNDLVVGHYTNKDGNAVPWTRQSWSLRSRKPSESSRRLRRKPPLC